jgi:hypothetical protein
MGCQALMLDRQDKKKNKKNKKGWSEKKSRKR